MEGSWHKYDPTVTQTPKPKQTTGEKTFCHKKCPERWLSTFLLPSFRDMGLWTATLHSKWIVQPCWNFSSGLMKIGGLVKDGLEISHFFKNCWFIQSYPQRLSEMKITIFGPIALNSRCLRGKIFVDEHLIECESIYSIVGARVGWIFIGPSLNFALAVQGPWLASIIL